MFAIRLDNETKQQLDLLAKSRGSSRSAVVREAIIKYLEDNEDLNQAEQTQSRIRGSKTLKQLRKDLGLDR